MTEFGPEILPGTPAYEWAARVISAVEERSGMPSRWNGKLYEETDPRLLGTAHDDGSMTLSRSQVFDPIERAYTHGPDLTPEQNTAARSAMVTTVHEARHLCHPLGETKAVAGEVKLYDPEEIALEEGLTDTWAHRNVDGVSQQIDLDQVAPGVVGGDTVVGYPAYGQATDALVSGLSDVTGVRASEIREQLHGTDRTERWNALAELVIDNRLDGLMPPDHHGQIHTRLRAAMRPEFANLPTVQLSGLFDERGLQDYGKATGEGAVARLNHTLGEVENHYHQWRAEQGPAASYESAPRVAPLSMQDIIRARQQAALQPKTDPEVANLRRFLGDHRPMTQAPAGTSEAQSNNVRNLRAKPEHGVVKE